MRHRGAAGVALAIAMMAGALGASGAAVEQDFMDRVRADALAASGGDLDRVGGTVTTYGADGRVARAIDGHEFLALVARVAEGRELDADAPRDDRGPSVGQGSRRLPGPTPNCERASLFTMYPGRAGASIVDAVPVGRGTGSEHCWWGGPNIIWGLVAMEPPEDALIACGYAMIMTPHPDGATTPGPGSRCGATTMVAHGEAKLIGAQYYGMAFDYFLGFEAHVTIR